MKANENFFDNKGISINHLLKVSEPWTPEGGLVTAAMKLKRKSIEHTFQVSLTYQRCLPSELTLLEHAFQVSLNYQRCLPSELTLLEHAFQVSLNYQVLPSK
jgi:hypothetical protein